MAMTVTELPPSAVMGNMTFGAFVGHMVGIVAELGVADLLKDGPRDSDQLAKSVGANPDALYRVLRARRRASAYCGRGGLKLTMPPPPQNLWVARPAS